MDETYTLRVLCERLGQFGDPEMSVTTYKETPNSAFKDPNSNSCS